MGETSLSGLAFDLLELAALMRQVENGETRLSSASACSVAESLYSIAEECERLEQALTVARRWATAPSFADCFSRDEAIRAGVRDGTVIDLVAVLEREMARNAALRGGAAS